VNTYTNFATPLKTNGVVVRLPHTQHKTLIQVKASKEFRTRVLRDLHSKLSHKSSFCCCKKHLVWK